MQFLRVCPADVPAARQGGSTPGWGRQRPRRRVLSLDRIDGLFAAALTSGVRAEPIAWLILPFLGAIALVLLPLALFPWLSAALKDAL